MPQPTNILDRILELVQKNGPSLPVDISSKLGLDSFLASAYMQQLVEQGRLGVGKKFVGGSKIFFIPGQESTAEAKAKALIEASQKTARTFASEVPENPEVQKKRNEFSVRLGEIESREKKSKLIEPHAVPEPGHKVIPITIKHVSQEVGAIPNKAVGGQLMPKVNIPEPEVKKESPKPLQNIDVAEVRYEAPKLEIPEPVIEDKAESEDSASLAAQGKSKIREVIESKFLKKPSPPLEPSPLVDSAMAMLVDAGCEIVGKELTKKGKEANIIFDLPTKIGNIKMLAVIRNKKSISEADLSMAYTEGVNRKMPVVFITNGRMTKNAQAYHQVIAGLLKFKTIESK